MTTSSVRREDVEHALSAGDMARALSLSEALLDASPEDPDSVAARATALLASGDAVAAADLLSARAGTAAAPRGYRSALAMCLVAAGDRPAAIEAFRLALAEAPDDFAGRLAYAECLELEGQEEAAVPEYFRAVRTAQGRGRWLSDDSTAPAMRERVKRAMGLIDRGRHSLFARLLQPHVDAHGRAAMTRVAQALDVYLGRGGAPHRDPRQQPKFFWMPGLPPTPFFGRERFDWYDALEAQTEAIRGELGALFEARRELAPFLLIDDKHAEEEYLGGDPQTRAWDAFFFHRHGVRHDDSHASCPRTSAALEKVPLTGIAGHAPEVLFSVLAPQTHIKPHHGVTNTRVVTHVPLLIPDGDCRLVVGGESHAWQRGRCVTFDDTFLHEAWNRTDETRVVLILDTWNPDLTPEECIALKDLIEGIGEFNLRAGAT